ncbi:hypothetical protein DSO57_1003701 [Entomophthora muscae]|uniref:Uncharacterized protein n=2 Tax=Entomophthora muscae TaxID=34485 RepID=A0ACC2U703_9FUNG|nr:hypothetical protein DSO57_1003701 [Entomophthora muscae]
MSQYTKNESYDRRQGGCKGYQSTAQDYHGNDGDTYAFIGTSIELNENRRVDGDKFVPAWRQEARDERGRRRFHGAFTGGFSAGYFNTVGSKEGWAPSEVAPTKEGRKETIIRKPEDYMDEEDLEDIRRSKETVAVHADDEDFSSMEAKRRALASLPNAIGAAPDSLLDLFIEQPKEALGATILKQMGWKPGYGIGPRRPQENPHKTYLGEASGISYTGMKTLLVPPPDTPLVVFSPQSHKEGVNLVPNAQDTKSQEVRSQLNSYLTHAQEHTTKTSRDGDYDPYSGPTKNSYNQTIVDVDADDDCIVLHRKKRRPPPPATASQPVFPSALQTNIRAVCHDGKPPLATFVLATLAYQEEWHEPIAVPSGFKPMHHFSRPKPDSTVPAQGPTFQGLASEARGALLGEAKTERSIFDFLSEKSKERIAMFARVAKEPPPPTAMDGALDLQLVLSHAMLDVASAQAALKGFVPFGDIPAKQERYKALLRFFSKESKLPPAWPQGTSMEDKIQEIKDFQKAAQLFRPLSNLMASKFVTATGADSLTTTKPGLTMVPAQTPDIAPMQVVKAVPQTPAQLGMFGRLTRTVVDFFPSRLLLKRFAIVDPHPGRASNQSNYQTSTAAAQKPALDPSSILPHFASSENAQEREVTPEPSLPDAPRPPNDLFKAIFGTDIDSD